MTLLAPSPTGTAAAAQASRNWQANIEALAIAQPWVIAAVVSPEPSVTWLFGRDGFLTAHDEAGRWWAGCSLPKRAGLTLLKKLSINGVVGCLLAPSHAGQVAAALEKLSPQQAVVVIQPDLSSMRVMLACCDFSPSIRQHRLWFAVGEQWPAMLAELFSTQPGLPTPTQFIRTLALDEALTQQIIPLAEQAFKETNTARAARITQIQSQNNRDADSFPPKILLAAGSHFRLWDDAGNTLLSTFTPHAHLDPDDPAQSSSLGLALAAADCDAIVIPHRSRSELPDVLPRSLPVISWIVQPCVPAFNPQHSHDALLLADESWLPLAHQAGWPSDRLQVAHWPSLDLAPASEKCLALIANTCSLETPVTKLDSSSHHLLWELIRSDLASGPFSLGTDVNGFIRRRMAKLGISDEGFDRALFIDQLIVPAYQQSLATLLLDAGLPLKLYGTGWDELPRLHSLWQGPVATRAQFRAAATHASALIYGWPTRYRHEIDAFNRPVLAPKIRTSDHWIRDARRILAEIPPSKNPTAAFSFAQIKSLIR